MWASEHIERYCDDSFYAFSRGDVLIATTNSQNTQKRLVTYHPYKAGTRICNQLNSSDCITIGSDNAIHVSLDGGLPKVYAPAQSASEEQENILIQ